MSEGEVNKIGNGTGSTIKFFVIFAVLSAVLFGGVYFAKMRNASYVASDAQPVAQNIAVTSAQDSDEISSSEADSSVAQPEPSGGGANDTVAATPSDEIAGEVPSTGPSSTIENIVTAALIFSTFYLCLRLHSMKLIYRKL